MIKYNELNVEDNFLHVKMQVENKPYYSDITIVGVRIDIPSTYGTADAYHTITQENSKVLEAEVYISKSINSLLIITPIISGIPSEDTPCGKDTVNKTAVYDSSIILKQSMPFLKELGDSCVTPRGFIDFILRKKALDLSIDTGNYTDAIKYWGLLTNNNLTTKTNNCGCHGFN